MEFRILGPVEVLAGDRSIPVKGTRQRVLLATLLLHAGQIVSTRRLMEALWGDNVPPTATKTLQVHMSRLRRDLGDDVRLATRAPGYILQLDRSELDVWRFEDLARQGRTALDSGDAAQAAALLREALALWRGPALADLADEPVARTAAPRLEDQRLAALEDRIDADLACGRAQEVVAEIAHLVEDHPLRERLRAQLMLALYQCGRQADALTAYQDARRTLAEELGIEPGPRLQELERRVLEQDPKLLRTSRVARTAPRPVQRPRRYLRAVGTVAVLAGLFSAAALATVRERTPPRQEAAATTSPFRAHGNTLIRIDAETGAPRQLAKVGKEPGPVVVTRDAAWVGNHGDRTVSRVELESGNVETIKGFPGVASLATTPLGGVFVSSFDRYVWFIDEVTLQRTRVVKLRGHAEGLAVGAGSLWVTSPTDERAVGKDQVVKVGGEPTRVLSRIRVGATPIFTAFGFGQLWTSNYDGDTLSVIPPGGDSADTVPVGDGPLGIAAGEGAVWIVQFGDQELWRLDPVTNEVVARVPVGPGPLEVAVGNGWVWVTCREDGTVVQIDPATNKVHRTVDVGLSPHGVAAVEGGALVTVRSAPYGP